VAGPIQANIQANTKTTFTLLINAFYVAFGFRAPSVSDEWATVDHTRVSIAPACAKAHSINRKTGKLMGGEDP
jgi:hypothetical protein